MTPTTRPGSRRERPAKAALTREGIIAAALQILENEGLGKVTMRRIAATLDTGAASLYVYVRNTADLHAQILDELLGRIEPVRTGTWRERLVALLEQYTAVLFQYPEIAQMSISTRPSGPNYLALLDELLGLLHEGGVGDAQAAWGVDLLLAFPTATAVEHGLNHQSGDNTADEALADLGTKIAAADPAVHLHLARLGDYLISGSGPERTRWGYDVLIDGISRAPRH